MNDYSRDEFEAMWQEFQRQGEEATCPACGAQVHVELLHDPAEGESEVAEIRVACPNCGRQAVGTPGTHSAYGGWKD